MADAKTKPEKIEKKTSVTKKFNFGLFLAYSAILLALLSLAFNFMVWHLSQKNWQSAKKNDDITLLKTKLDDMNQKLEHTVAPLQQDQTILSEKIESLLQDKGSHNKLAAFSLILQKLKLAELVLSYNDDPNTSISLLKSALEDLNSENDQALDPLKQNIHKDIDRIEAYTPLDQTALITELVQLQNFVPQLTFKDSQVPKFKPQDDTAKPAPKNSSRFNAYLENLKNGLSKLVIITKQDGESPNFLTPMKKQSALQMLQFYLQQSQWAIQQQNQKIFDLSMLQAQQLFKTYFDTEAENGQEFLGKLSSLQNAFLNPEKPDLRETIGLAEQLFFSHSPSKTE